jgi:hypothetical protein
MYIKKMFDKLSKDVYAGCFTVGFDIIQKHRIQCSRQHVSFVFAAFYNGTYQLLLQETHDQQNLTSQDVLLALRQRFFLHFVLDDFQIDVDKRGIWSTDKIDQPYWAETLPLPVCSLVVAGWAADGDIVVLLAGGRKIRFSEAVMGRVAGDKLKQRLR